jgi:hypothetical protein
MLTFWNSKFIDFDWVILKILELVDTSGYQLACQRYFEFTHKTEEIVTINHPNQYFESSYRINNGQSINQKTQNKYSTSTQITQDSQMKE